MNEREQAGAQADWRACLQKFLDACLELDAIGDLDPRFPGELMDEAQALLRSKAPAAQTVKGEDAWLDEFVGAAIGREIDSVAGRRLLRDRLRTAMRAFSANLNQQTPVAQPATAKPKEEGKSGY